MIGKYSFNVNYVALNFSMCCIPAYYRIFWIQNKKYKDNNSSSTGLPNYLNVYITDGKPKNISLHLTVITTSTWITCTRIFITKHRLGQHKHCWVSTESAHFCWVNPINFDIKMKPWAHFFRRDLLFFHFF